MVEEKQKPIPYFAEINDFLEAAQVSQRTGNPAFYCMRLKEHKGKIYMPPFRRGFYFVGLLTTKNNNKVTLNNNVENVYNFVRFHKNQRHFNHWQRY